MAEHDGQLQLAEALAHPRHLGLDGGERDAGRRHRRLRRRSNVREHLADEGPQRARLRRLAAPAAAAAAAPPAAAA